jgi:hypothetical protein
MIEEARYCADLQELGGAEGIRTPDPLHAMEVRYQLRYSPVSQIIVSVNRRQHTGCEYLIAPTVPARLPRGYSNEPPTPTPTGRPRIDRPGASFERAW